MYAIIQDGGRQYKVSPGTIFNIDKRACEPGKEIEFKNVIYFHDQKEIKIGNPTVPNMKVKAVVEKTEKGPKIVVFFYRQAKDSRRKRGHRQHYTRVRVSEIVKE